MFQWIKQRSGHGNVAQQLYGSIVSQARQPAFYRDFGVPDTVDGRFEMICLHIFGVMERLGSAGANDSVGRDLVEHFFTDMDDAMREIGIGDSSVPKKMRKASEALYGRVDAYAKAVRSTDPQTLTQALQRNVFGAEEAGDIDPMQTQALAGYVHDMLAHLNALQTEALVDRGQVSFTDLGQGTS